MEDKIMEGIAYALPALATGAMVYLTLNKFVEVNANEKKFNTLIDKKKESLPLKLQAYERLVLFCERINPAKLLVRVNPIGEDADSYLHLLLGNIEQEFEHNMVQQLYVSDDAWKAVLGSKLAITSKISEYAKEIDSAEELRTKILQEYTENESPTETTIAFIKSEVKQML